MAEMLRAVVGDDALIVYLSTGAWNFAPHLESFMAEHRFPPGPLLLTDWGPTQSGWFRSGANHKREMLERLRAEHPHARWMLIGDDGQRDPLIYGEFAKRHPEAVVAIAIRQLTVIQQVLAKGPAAGDSGSTIALGPVAAPVAWVAGADGFALWDSLSALGLALPRAHVA